MPDDYYDESDNPGSMGSMMEKREMPEKEGMEPVSALVPKSFFAGKKGLEVGDTEAVKVLRIMDDEVEIECVKENYEQEEEAPVQEEDEMMA